jgi:putative sterol carrier protein
VVLTTDHSTFAGIGSGGLSPADAIRAGKLTVEGDPAAAARCAAVFGVGAEPEAASASAGAAA